MKLKTYFQNKFVRYGSIGAFVAALCCFTPLLVVGLAALGLAGLTAYLDFVLLPVLFLAVGAVLIGVRQVRKHEATPAKVVLAQMMPDAARETTRFAGQEDPYASSTQRSYHLGYAPFTHARRLAHLDCHLPGVRRTIRGGNAHRKLPVLLGMPVLRARAPSRSRRLLRLLLLRRRPLPTHPAGRVRE